MKSYSFYLLIALVWGLAGCGSSETPQETGVRMIPECKFPPRYLPMAGFLPGKDFGFSVSESGVTGLSLVQFPKQGIPYKRFTLPSWSSAGHLGAVVTDREGNCYVIPRPYINTLQNNPLQQNVLYRVDSETGEMKPFVELPSVEPPNRENPYGLMGLVLDCETDILYVTSVMGSDRLHARGSIYAVSLRGKVISRFTHLDPMGVGIGYVNGKKILFFGNARNGDVYQLELDTKGRFAGQPVRILSLRNLGERGDDKPRKIRINNQGELLVSGISFNFNLANAPEKMETIYKFGLHPENGWILTGMAKGQM